MEKKGQTTSTSPVERRFIAIYVCYLATATRRCTEELRDTEARYIVCLADLGGLTTDQLFANYNYFINTSAELVGRCDFS